MHKRIHKRKSPKRSPSPKRKRHEPYYEPALPVASASFTTASSSSFSSSSSSSSTSSSSKGASPCLVEWKNEYREKQRQFNEKAKTDTFENLAESQVIFQERMRNHKLLTVELECLNHGETEQQTIADRNKNVQNDIRQWIPITELQNLIIEYHHGFVFWVSPRVTSNNQVFYPFAESTGQTKHGLTTYHSCLETKSTILDHLKPHRAFFKSIWKETVVDPETTELDFDQTIPKIVLQQPIVTCTNRSDTVLNIKDIWDDHNAYHYGQHKLFGPEPLTPIFESVFTLPSHNLEEQDDDPVLHVQGFWFDLFHWDTFIREWEELYPQSKDGKFHRCTSRTCGLQKCGPVSNCEMCDISIYAHKSMKSIDMIPYTRDDSRETVFLCPTCKQVADNHPRHFEIRNWKLVFIAK